METRANFVLIGSVTLAVIAAVIVSVFAGWGIDQGAATIIGMLSLMPALIVITVLLIAGWPRSIAGYVFLAIGGVFSFIVGSGGYQMITENYHGWTQAVPAALPLVLVPLASSAFTWMSPLRCSAPAGLDESDAVIALSRPVILPAV